MSVKQDLEAGEFYENIARALMGSKKYDEWVKSQEVNLYTNFGDFEEIKKFILKAGYDFQKIETSKYLYLKTHIANNDASCIYWIIRNNKVTASLTVQLNDDNLKKFVSKIEDIVGHTCFFKSIESANKLPEQIFATAFSDKIILKKAMANVGLTVNEKNGALYSNLQGSKIILQDSKNSNFEFKVIGYANLENIYPYFKKIENEYNKIVQENICENIREKVKQSNNMYIENEEILEDNSVLLTIRV